MSFWGGLVGAVKGLVTGFVTGGYAGAAVGLVGGAVSGSSGHSSGGGLSYTPQLPARAIDPYSWQGVGTTALGYAMTRWQEQQQSRQAMPGGSYFSGGGYYGRRPRQPRKLRLRKIRVPRQRRMRIGGIQLYRGRPY